MNGEQYIDLGFVTNADGDFDVSYELHLPNREGRTLEILDIKKSCTCQVVELSPQRYVKSNEELEVSIGRHNVTSGKSGYFHDVVYLTLTDGVEKSGFAIHYSGFVLNTYYTYPKTLEFYESVGGEEKSALVFVSRLSRQDNDDISMSSPEIASIDVPAGLSARPVHLADIEHIVTLRPKISASAKDLMAASAHTRTERALQRILKANPHAFDAENLWLPVLLRIRVDEPSRKIDDLITLVTDTGRVQIPVRVFVRAPVEVVPDTVGIWTAKRTGDVVVALRSSNGQELYIESAVSHGSFAVADWRQITESESEIVLLYRARFLGHKFALS